MLHVKYQEPERLFGAHNITQEEQIVQNNHEMLICVHRKIFDIYEELICSPKARSLRPSQVRWF
jgi:hypothetical protein